MTSGTVVIILIVLVWLFVLAPWLLGGHKPMSKAGVALDETRLLYKGGSQPIATQPRPAVSAKDVHTSRTEHFDEDLLEAEERESVKPFASVSSASAVSSVQEAETEDAAEYAEVSDRVHADDVTYDDDFVDGEVIYELESPAESEPEVVIEDSAEEPYAYDETYIAPDDFLYQQEQAEQFAEAPELPAEQPKQREELTAEEMEFALRRSARGGWNPQREAALRADRLRRRRRSVGILGLLAIIALALAFAFGGWLWVLGGIATVCLVGYLITLRAHVRSEQALHRRRVEQLRRARLGVRNAHDEELGIPQRLRHPGAVVLELDDDSPDFDDLEVWDESDTVVPLSSRRVG